ncbi:DNA helicase II UvrD [Helicobacter sp. NHP19-003]|uniref:DNA 3'-5' helicase n=1 Tax=Helicobacter gastrocanis TaxID=2849641 RepID=A0ABM7SJB5_9HELI|nr:ATP-dependent helicase [Helicobacter sp. NHP19-003]BCZ17789.1 DNA helicase II UvrD [Helicobacter sp. NHP19-003]
MNLANLLIGLNPAQQEAVRHTKGPLLILAGAGSGKTKTLTTRLAYLIGYQGVPAEQTLTLTFTNKAAQEMRQRAMALLGKRPTFARPSLTTFHGFGYFFLKERMGLLGRGTDFSLKKPKELKKELKPLLLSCKNKNNPLEDAVFLNYLFKQFGQIKNHLIDLKNCRSDVQRAFRVYTQRLEQENWVDFDDLIFLPHLILEETPALARQMSAFYQYISVDEYQDTNPLQFKLLKQLCSTHENLCVVGDDDQSIYGFRGADINNILEFQDRFPKSKIIKLEQNYRSTPEILGYANRLIAHNQHRHEKTLISQKNHGVAKTLEDKHFCNTLEEHGFILKKIAECRAKDIPYEEIAILYRLNDLAKELEKTLRQANIPYTIVGQIGFFERAEIKDRLAYLRALANRHDDEALLRLFGKLEGLGKTSVEKIQIIAARHGYSIAQAHQAGLLKDLPSKARQSLQEFFALLDSLSIQAMQFKTPEQALELLANYAQIDNNTKIDAEGLECLGTFATMLVDSISESLEFKAHACLQDFLDQIALESIPLDSKNSKGVRCMTVHASKGLEFSVVFVVGFEEGFFPYINAENVEEERRLGYVAITRAKEELYLCSASERLYYGQIHTKLSPSCFIQEAKGLVQTLCVGDCVHHPHYGFGLIKHIQEKHLEVFFTHGLVCLLPNSVKKMGL